MCGDEGWRRDGRGGRLGRGGGGRAGDVAGTWRGTWRGSGNQGAATERLAGTAPSWDGGLAMTGKAMGLSHRGVMGEDEDGAVLSRLWDKVHVDKIARPSDPSDPKVVQIASASRSPGQEVRARTEQSLPLVVVHVVAVLLGRVDAQVTASTSRSFWIST